MSARALHTIVSVGLGVMFATGPARAETAAEVRALIVSRVGGLDAMQVPAADHLMPQPDDPRFRITPEKKLLGKLLYFDPVRSNNIRPEMGGNRSMAQSISCGSCHVAAAASKAGAVTAIAMGGQGRGRVDPFTGRFIATREPRPGVVDLLPTQVDVFDGEGNLAMSGRFDGLDAPLRVSPNMIGFATNQRLFWSGPAGEPYDPANPAKLNINPNNLPPGENTAEFTFKAHRMTETQRFALQAIPVYRELFRRAFPDEAAATAASGNRDDLINDLTIARAVAAFLRTVMTRNTPYDRFLAGDDAALTARQLRGASLFFTPADQGGAGCVACHSGPALNKILGDEAGQLIGENFHNIGLGDHPLVELARQTLSDPDIHDVGREEATGDPADRFKFKAPTLRQVRDGAPFMHNGGFDSVRAVVEYFNNGVPASELAASAGNVSPLFTEPRGAGTTGLMLSEDDIVALVDFLENGLYDPAFVTYDPNSSTDTFELNVADLTYPIELIMLGAINGKVPSRLQHPQTDAQSTADLIAAGTPPTLCGLLGIWPLGMTVAPLLLAKRSRHRAARRV